MRDEVSWSQITGTLGLAAVAIGAVGFLAAIATKWVPWYVVAIPACVWLVGALGAGVVRARRAIATRLPYDWASTPQCAWLQSPVHVQWVTSQPGSPLDVEPWCAGHSQGALRRCAYRRARYQRGGH